MKIIIVGHGKYASGMKSCIKSLVDLDEIIDINYEKNKSVVQLKEEIKKELEIVNKAIVFVDIVGSATFKAATKAVLENNDSNKYVIAEASVSCILEILMKTIIAEDYENIREKIDKAIKNSNEIVILDKGVISYE